METGIHPDIDRVWKRREAAGKHARQKEKARMTDKTEHRQEVQERIERAGIKPGKKVVFEDHKLQVAEVNEEGEVVLVFQEDPSLEYEKTLGVFSPVFNAEEEN